MIPFSGIPFLRFTLAFISGIFFYLFVQPATDFFLLSLASLFLYLVLFILQNQKKERFHHLSPYIGLSSLITLFFIGSTFTYWADDLNTKNHLINISQKGEAYEAIVISNPEEKASSIKVELEIEKLFYEDSTYFTSSQSYLYISKKNFRSNELAYGDRIIVNGWPDEINSPMNPFEFDFKKRSKFVHFYHQQFITRNDFKVLGKNEGNPVIAFAFYLRLEADKIIRKFVSGKEEQDIASALLLGLKNNLSQDIKNIYSTTGTTHVLAVSGMHVTVLLQLLMSLFILIKSKRIKNLILPVLLLIVLWIYVFITGFSPSVLRAGVTFSIIIFGNLLGRNSNIYNSIFLSAFILLCYDPYMIMDVGFQLSYLAVISLIFFTDRIYLLVEFNSRVVDVIWNLLAVSIAAQIITLPLCIYYFHQIPISALISNLIAVPISSVLLYLGIVLLLSSFIPVLPNMIGYIFGKLIQLMNFLLGIISDIDFATIQGVNIDLIELVLIYLIIICITLFIILKKRYYFVTSCSLLGVCLLLISWQMIELKNQKKIVVYNIKNHKVLALIQGTKAYLLGDSLNEVDFRFHIQPSMIAYGINSIIKNKDQSPLSSYSQPEYDLFVFQKKSFLVIKDLNSEFTLPPADYILTNRKYTNKINGGINSKIVLSAGGNKSVDNNNCYDMNKRPAIVLDFNN